MSHNESRHTGKNTERPSFESWWKRSKEVLKTRRLTFVSQQAECQSGEGQDVSPNQTPSDRVKARRAQVRKAQIEHRQRKADYVKHLEIDVSSIRDMIAATQKEVRLLKNRNNALRTRLVAGLAQPSPSLLEDQELAAGEPLHDFDMSLLDHDLHEVGLSLELDAAMSLPVYHVSSSKPSNSNCQATIALNPFSGLGNLETPSYLLSHLTPQQTQQTINYILT